MVKDLEATQVIGVDALLAALRRRPDTIICNPFGERVWLKECFSGKKRIGVTDCCPEDSPCEWHSALSMANTEGAKA